MTLIIILICTAIEQFTQQLNQLRRYNWLKHYLSWFQRTFPNLDGTLSIVLLLLPILGTMVIFIISVNAILLFVLSVLVLSYSIGPKNTNVQATDYCDAMESGDSEAAALFAEKLCGKQMPVNDAEQLNQQVINGILANTHERITSVFFWFLVLGPVGALLYRCSEQLKGFTQDKELQPFQQATQRLHFILSYIPARITAFSYALGGSMNDAIKNWRDYNGGQVQCTNNNNCGIVVASGLGALQINHDSESNSIENVRSALALSNRALIIWISFLAILTLAGFV